MKHSCQQYVISCFKHKCYHYVIRKTHFQYARTGKVLLGQWEQVFHSEEQPENIIVSKMKHSCKKIFMSCFKHKCYHYIIRKTHFQYARAGNVIIYTRSASFPDILNIFNCHNVILVWLLELCVVWWSFLKWKNFCIPNQIWWWLRILVIVFQ